jgi:hypothetical protein
MPQKTWSDKDFEFSQDESGFVHDDLADHNGNLQRGYDVGSLTEGLVAYYPMEESGSTVLHDGALDNLAQINGATWNGSGQVGSDSLSFDGTDDEAQLPDLGLSHVSPWTISVWVNHDTLPSNTTEQVYFGRYDGSDDLIELYGDTSDSWGFQAGHAGNADDVLISGGSISTGTWTHLAVTNDGRNTYQLFENGSQIDSQTLDLGSQDYATDAGPSIGRRSDGVNPFDGLIDDVRIYDRALSQQEIQALANLTSPSGRFVTESDVPSQSDNGVARYEFEQDVTDSWGSNDGTDNTSAGYVNGVYGDAKDFDGTDDQVDTSALNNYGGSTTLSTWVYSPDIGTSAPMDILELSNTTGGYNLLLFHNSSEFRAQVFDGSTVNQTAVSASGYGSEWVHLCVYHDTNDIYLYVNGKLVDKTSITITIPSDSDGYTIGGDDFWNGHIDDVRIYSKALSPTEVEQLYNKGSWRIARGEI